MESFIPESVREAVNSATQLANEATERIVIESEFRKDSYPEYALYISFTYATFDVRHPSDYVELGQAMLAMIAALEDFFVVGDLTDCGTHCFYQCAYRVPK